MGSSSSKGGYDLTSNKGGQVSDIPTYNTEETGRQKKSERQRTTAKKPPSSVVAKATDFKDGEMKEVDLSGGGKAILIKDSGQFYAVSPKCTHFGAPLVKGALCQGRLRCQWHGACFNYKTGDIEDYPGLDSLQTYEVEVSNDEVRIHSPPDSKAITKRIKSMVCGDVEDNSVYIIIGGGGAAAVCAETLRQEGFKGRVVIATKEACLPYDRTKISKALDTKIDTLQLRNQEFYSVYDIEVKTNKEVTKLDTVLKEVVYSDGSRETFDKVLIATGGSPRRLSSLPGIDLEQIYYLRSLSDANEIAEKINKKDVVIIGTSFIGLELAGFASNKASSVTVIGRGQIPLSNVFGDKIGLMFKSMHEEKGTKFIMESQCKEFCGDKGRVERVILEDGLEVKADVVIVAIGVEPTTGFLEDSGVTLNDRGLVIVDEHQQTNKSDIYAAGDVTEFPFYLRDNEGANVQHWQMACKQGQVAAKNMCGHKTPLRSVPYFWTMQFGKSVRYAGYGLGYDDIVFHGEPSDGKFVAYYTKGPDVIAVATLNSDPIASQVAEMMFAGHKIFKEEVTSSMDSWLSRLNS